MYSERSCCIVYDETQRTHTRNVSHTCLQRKSESVDGCRCAFTQHSVRMWLRWMVKAKVTQRLAFCVWRFARTECAPPLWRTSGKFIETLNGTQRRNYATFKFSEWKSTTKSFILTLSSICVCGQMHTFRRSSIVLFRAFKHWNDLYCACTRLSVVDECVSKCQHICFSVEFTVFDVSL